MFLDIGGHRCLAVDLGAGPRTFVAHSGWIGTYEDWLPTLEILSKSWRAVAYDHRGAGETVVPREAITAEALLDDIFRVQDALGLGRAVLGGFSAGAGFAARAVLRHPERFAGLVLLNGPTRVQLPGAAPAPPLPPPSRWPGADHRDRMRWFIERCTPEPDVEHIRRWGEHILMRAAPDAAERLWEIIPPADDAFLDQLARIAVPTLLIHGARDPFVSTAAMEHVASRIPGSKLVVLEGTGHLPALTRPREVAALIDDFFAPGGRSR